jgi:hypothetical protein
VAHHVLNQLLVRPARLPHGLRLLPVHGASANAPQACLSHEGTEADRGASAAWGRSLEERQSGWGRGSTG